MLKKRFAAIATAVAATTALALTGCQAGGQTSGEGSTGGSGHLVVTTTTQTADFAKNVLEGSGAEVHSLVKPNQSAHDVELTPADLAELAKADVIVVNGAGLDDWAEQAIASSGFKGKKIDASEGIELSGEHHHDDEGEAHDHDHDHDHGAEGNPHIWTDPHNAKLMVENIERGLTGTGVASDDAIARAGDAYARKLDELDRWLRESVDRVPVAERKLVSTHDAFWYYLKAYDITQVGLVIPSFNDNAEPNAAEVQQLVDAIKATGTKAVFSETSINPKQAEIIAQQSGARVYSGEDALYGDSLGEPGGDGDTYLKATEHNTRLILESWGATPGDLPEDLR